MTKVFAPLAELEFANVLTEAQAQTQTGEALLNKYRTHLLSNAASCTLVNNFLKESQNCAYDNGVSAVASYIAQCINEHRVGWQLATACESVNNSRSNYAYLNRNAAKQVEKLLEMNETDVVKYIKAGALKNVMFVEEFRNIVKSVYRDQPMVFENAEYRSVSPISMVEQHDDKMYFQVRGKIYEMCNNTIAEAKRTDVTNDFIVVNQLLESKAITFADDKFTANVNGAQYVIEGENKCVRTGNGQTLTMDAAQLREHNRMFVSASTNKGIAGILEALAKLTENYDNVAVLDNVRVVTTNNDEFVTILHENNLYCELLASRHASGKWQIDEPVIEALEYIKKQTRTDLKEHYEKQIEALVESRTAEEKQQLQESLREKDINDTKKRIATLTEKYKNDPVRLAMLSRLAQDIATL